MDKTMRRLTGGGETLAIRTEGQNCEDMGRGERHKKHTDRIELPEWSARDRPLYFRN